MDGILQDNLTCKWLIYIRLLGSSELYDSRCLWGERNTIQH